MHSVFYAAGHLARVGMQPVGSTNKPIETKRSAVEMQAKICAAILLLAWSAACALWVIGSFI
ncbi:hypothetical protein OH720_16110 [Pseudomonas sp. WJP1]|uniref:hypothetical protein n=1 Tax=Pseudomonas sp. WJP1 TaxID=2986947 RepID=UPI00234930F1|nr:hypothetical protein [Pseudomonas sp. WJP1]WCM48558.1 hypothetical protein OH720_16110 [Pseudomonas sp. WJP1]